MSLVAVGWVKCECGRVENAASRRRLSKLLAERQLVIGIESFTAT